MPQARASRATGALLVASIGLLLLVGWSGPNLAKPDLGPRGWAPGTLPFALGGTATTVALVIAYLLGGAGVLLALVTRRGVRLRWPAVWSLAGLAAFATPFGSADHTNYAAYGRIFSQGGDPYVEAPIGWHGGTDPITRMVEPPYTTTPSVYGPFGTLLQALAAWLGGDTLRQVVWIWQLILIGCWLGCRWLLLRLTDDVERVDLLWTANPLVVGTGLLGAHVDLVATTAAVAMLVLATRSSALTGLALALAASTKVTYAAGGIGVLVAWWLFDRSKALRHTVIGAGSFLAVAGLLHLLLGRHVYDTLGSARQSVSLATPWRFLVEMLTGPLSQTTVRSVVFALATIFMIVMAWLLSRVTDGLAPQTVTGQAVRWTFVLTAAYVLVAPYSLPWYDQLVWALLPVLAASRLDVVLLARGLVMAWAYVPGRTVGLTQPGPAVMLGVRRVAGPIVGFATWLAISVLAGRRVTSRSPHSHR